jgi:predicted alpha-1,2-mannosidase
MPALIIILLAACGNPENKKSTSAESLFQYVDPLIGTAEATTGAVNSEGSASHGQTFPAIGEPFAMTSWTPQTRNSEKKCVSPYYYEDSVFTGFRGSHWMSGSCTQDYGSFTLIPMGKKLITRPSKQGVAFSHQTEKATPAYYKLNLNKYGLLAELTGACRSGIMKFTYNSKGSRYFFIQPNSDEGQGFIEIHPEKNEIAGYNPVHRIYQGWGKYAGYNGYFVVRFNKPFEAFGTLEGKDYREGKKAARGNKNQVGSFVKIACRKNNPVIARAATSFTSIENARENLKKEIGDKSFESIRKATRKKWNNSLRKILVKGGSEEQKTIFYTGLYHAMILPRIYNDVDGSYPGFGDDDKIHQAKDFIYYDDFSLWDTYRALHPLYTIIAPERTEDMIQSLIAKAKQGGWLPIFPCWNSYTSEMIGDHAVSVIGDAWLKGIRGFNIDSAYHYMHKNAFDQPENFETYRDGKGRRALDNYMKYGYIPLEDSVKNAFHQQEQVSRTLEYAYDDFVLSRIAKKLGKMEVFKKLEKRALNYQQVLDTTTDYVRGRHQDGHWIQPFYPRKKASYITEGTPYQYTWYVPHDQQGLINLMGKDKYTTRLDTFFSQRHYWHGNEPSHQTPYLFNYAGKPYKTQAVVRKILNEEYGPGPGGLSGNDDTGQLSAWAVFSMMGFYPVCPGTGEYIIGSPVFDEIAINPGSNNPFVIKTKNNGNDNIYIQKASLNKKPYNKNFITHERLNQGGTLQFIMGSEPNKNWGSLPRSLPYSMSNDNNQ